MYIYKKCCNNCLLVSFSHTDVCKRCGFDSFSTIDDFVENKAMINDNADVIQMLRDKANEIEAQVNDFNANWFNVWDTEEDKLLDFPCTQEIVDYSYLEDIL